MRVREFWMCMSVKMFECVWVYVCVCVHMGVNVHVCLCVWMYLNVCEYISYVICVNQLKLCVKVCVNICEWVSECVNVCECVNVLWMRVNVNVYMCVNVYVGQQECWWAQADVIIGAYRTHARPRRDTRPQDGAQELLVTYFPKLELARFFYSTQALSLPINTSS